MLATYRKYGIMNTWSNENCALRSELAQAGKSDALSFVSSPATILPMNNSLIQIVIKILTLHQADYIPFLGLE
jgi:hypothetical protein